MKTYYLINVLTLMFFVTVPVQSQPNRDIDTVKESKELPAVKVDKVKDSILHLTNKELDEAIRKGTVIPKKQEQLLNYKEQKRKARLEYIRLVNEYIAQKGRPDKVVVIKKKDDAFTQLKKGEIYLSKDSTCVKSRRPLFGKKKCIEWSYNFYLEDKTGKIEKLKL